MDNFSLSGRDLKGRKGCRAYLEMTGLQYVQISCSIFRICPRKPAQPVGGAVLQWPAVLLLKMLNVERKFENMAKNECFCKTL